MKNLFLLIVLFHLSNSFAQYTAIPDPIFEQKLVLLEIDSDNIVNGQVLTSDVNQVTNLDLSQFFNGSLNNIQGIEAFIALEEIRLQGNVFLTALDFSNNTLLKKIICDQNHLETLNISNCTFLELLDCSNNFLGELNVWNNLMLTELLCYNNNLTQLNVSNNVDLNVLGIWNNNIGQLNVTSNLLLTVLEISNNNISSIDVSQNTLLKFLSCGYNQLTSLTLDANSNLSYLYCKNNEISYLNLNNCAFIDANGLNYGYPYLNCSNNNLTELYIQNGNNALLNGTIPQVVPFNYNRFDATNNPSLNCIFVDDVTNCNANWHGVDPSSSFVSTQTECNLALNKETFMVNKTIVFPNPVKDILFVSNLNEKIQLITIYDLLGKKILEQNSNSNKLDVSEVKIGFYMVFIKTNTSFYSEKILKL